MHAGESRSTHVFFVSSRLIRHVMQASNACLQTAHLPGCESKRAGMTAACTDPILFALNF